MIALIVAKRSGRTGPVLRCLLVLCGLVVASPLPAGSTRGPTAEDVKALLGKYRAERDRAEEAGATTRFLPILTEKADEMAKKAEAALAAGRLAQASEAVRQARWQLPYQPANLPDHVARILGGLRLRHHREIHALAFSPDGTALATASGDETVKLWDMGNGHERLTYTGHADRVRHVAFGPDGKFIVSAGAEKDVRVWDPATGKDIRTFKGPGLSVSALALSRDGKHLVVGHLGNDGNTKAILNVYEMETGKVVRTDTDFRESILTLAFNPAGTVLAVGDNTGQTRLWEYPRMVENAGQPAYWAKQDPTGATYHLTFSPDGQTFARCGVSDVKLFGVPQPGAGLQLNEPKRHIAGTGRPLVAAYSPDGKTLLIGGADFGAGRTDGVIRQVDPETGNVIATLRGHAGPVQALAVHPAGTQVAAAGTQCAVRLWDLGAAAPARDFPGHAGSVWAASFSPDAARVASASADRTVRVWDLATGKTAFKLTGHTGPVTVAQFSPAGKLLASAGADKVVRLWDADSGKAVRVCEGHTGTVTALDFAPDGTQLVTAGADRKVIVWDPATGKPRATLEEIDSVPAAVAFRPDGKQVAVGSIDQTVSLYEAATGKRQHRWTAHGGAVTALAYSPTGQLLASGGADQAIQVWPLATPGTQGVRIAGHTGPVSALAFRKDGQHLASGAGDQFVKLWKLEGNGAREAQSFRGHRDWVTAVAFSRDGFHLASASVDKLVKVWEITSRDLPVAAEHTGAVDAIAFSPDGKQIATGSADTTIKVWDRATGAEAATLTGHLGSVLSLAYTPDGKRLVSSGAEAAIRLWDLNPPREVDRTAAQLQAFARLRIRSPYIFLHPDGQRLFVWLPVDEARVSTIVEGYDLATGAHQFSLTEDNRKINSLAFSLDGRAAATGAKDGSVRLWDLDRRAVAAGGDWHLFEKVSVADLALTPDAKTLVVTNDEGEVKVATVAKRAVRHTLKAHDGRIIACIVSPDGKRFATVGLDNVVKVWDLEAGTELRRWEMGGGPARGYAVLAVAFAPDGKQLVTANANTTVYVLDLP